MLAQAEIYVFMLFMPYVFMLFMPLCLYATYYLFIHCNIIFGAISHACICTMLYFCAVHALERSPWNEAKWNGALDGSLVKLSSLKVWKLYWCDLEGSQPLELLLCVGAIQRVVNYWSCC